MAKVAGVSRDLVRRGIAELQGEEPPRRSLKARRPGGGRKRAEVSDPGLLACLNEQVGTHLAAGAPVLSLETKKKELVGEFKNQGREWLPKGQPEQVQVHDFVDPEHGRAIPYGIYDVGRNTGWVSVGIDHDTASFAVATLRRWWQGEGREA